MNLDLCGNRITNCDVALQAEEEPERQGQQDLDQRDRARERRSDPVCRQREGVGRRCHRHRLEVLRPRGTPSSSQLRSQ